MTPEALERVLDSDAACLRAGCDRPRRGRHGRFCSDACRAAAWKAEHGGAQRLIEFTPPPEPVLPLGPTPAQVAASQKAQTVRTLRMLQEAGPRGVTTGEFIRAGIARFSARIGELKAVGWVIAGKREHEHGWRFTLEGRG